MPRITDFCICMYVFGCKLSLIRLCDSDLGITRVGVITIGITCAAFCFHIAHISFVSSLYLFCLSVNCFGEIMCIRDSYIYQKGVLCFFIHECYVKSVRRNCFVRNDAAVTLLLLLLLLLLLCTVLCNIYAPKELYVIFE